MTDERYPEVPREVLRPAKPGAKARPIVERLRDGHYWVTAADCTAAAETIDALVAALTLIEDQFSDNPPLTDGQSVVLTNHEIAIINAALALARR